MKKIYSIVLMATALLVGTNVNAATIQVASADDLVQAFEDAANGDVIQLTANIDIPGVSKTKSYKTVNGVKYYYPYAVPFITIDGQDVTLDLNGFNIQDEAGKYRKIIFYLKKGQLNVNGNGSIVCNNNNNGVAANDPSGGYPIYVSGNADSLAIEGAWTSKLTVGAGVTLVGNAAGAYIDANGNAYTLSDGTYVNGLSDADVDGENALLKNATVQPKASNGRLVCGNTGKACAFNAYIDILAGAKVKGAKYGAQFSGNIKYVPNEDHREYLPTIYIHNGAEALTIDGTKNYSVGAYNGGFGRLIVEGDVHGATGVYAKSGEIEINDGATVSSDADTYVATGDKRSGVESAGSGILMDSNAAYAGNMTITVSGDAQISGNGGYAVESTITYGGDKGNQVEGITLEGGNFTSGDLGCLDIAPVIADIANVNVTIDNVNFNAAEDDVQINALLAATGDTYIVTAVEDADGNDVLVIVPLENGQTVQHNVDLNNLAAGQTVIELAGGTQTLNKDIELDNLTLIKNASDEGAEVIVPENITLKVGSITIDATSSITVKAGGSLVITGVGGIATYNTDNIIIEAQEGKMGRFFMSPTTTSRKNPAAKVELHVSCFGDDNYQRIGVPASAGLTPLDIVKGDATTYYYYYWDKTLQDWKNINVGTFVMQPFQGIAFRNNATAAGKKISFPCNLVGNSNGILDLEGDWTSFANSYTADIDLFALLSSLLTNNNITAAAYVWNITNQNWDVVSWQDLKENMALQTKLEPMQAFVYNLAGEGLTSATAEINYEEAVWNPVFNPAPKPIRRSLNNDLTRVVVKIEGANGEYDYVTLRQSSDFSAEFDNGSEIRKNLSLNSSNIFATTQLGEMAQVAENNLDGIRLSIATEKETMFKMTFNHVCGEQLAIRDNVTGTTIAITEGAEYFFTVAENSISERFEIINIKNAPTDVELIQVAEGAKAVYTIMGQYVGTIDNWNVLPAGIYVVDGVKMVK